MNTLYIMVGCPGCGKSTYLKNNNCQYVISRDEVRFSMLNDEDDYFAKEDDVFANFIYKICVTMVHTGGDYNAEVYVDATHLNARGRNKLLNAIEKTLPNFRLDWDVMPIVFDVPFDTCIERNEQRSGRALVPLSAMRRMYSSLQFPTKEEGFNKYIKVDKDGVEWEVILE